MTQQLHETQLGILNKLLFAPNLRYKDLKLDDTVENNTFQFHLNKVIELGYVVKNNNTYSLTKEGKKYATHLDTDTNKIVELRKVSVHLYCIRSTHNGDECVIYTRKKHPFYGKQGFPAGKVRNGELFVDAAKREMKEETNLEGDPVLFNVTHYLVKDKITGELLDDKLFLDFFIKNPTGTLKSNNEGLFEWVPTENIEKYILNPFDTIEIYQKSLKKIASFKGTVSFDESEHLTSDF